MIRLNETKSLTHQMSKMKPRKKNQSRKGSKRKEKNRGQTKIFIWRVKLNWKKEKINQKNENEIKKKQQKLWLNDEIESKKYFNKSVKKKRPEKKTKHIRNCNWMNKLKHKTKILYKK